MTPVLAQAALVMFVLFCRIGGCLMLMPGFASPRIPMHVRLWIAVATTLALAPVLFRMVEPAVAKAMPLGIAGLISSETLIGAVIGCVGRLFFLALQYSATAVANFIGLGAFPQIAIEETELQPPLVSLITLSAVVLIFIADQHWEILRALKESYDAIPAGAAWQAQAGLIEIVDRLTQTAMMALRVASPFIVYAVIVNFAVGLTNKLTPQISVYFVSISLVVAGGMFLLYFTIAGMLQIVRAGFTAWLAFG